MLLILFAVLAEALELEYSAQPVVADRVWRLGRRHLGSRFREFFFGAVEFGDVPTSEINRQMGASSGILLLPASAAVDPSRNPQLRAVDVSTVAEINNDHISVDVAFIEDLFLDDGGLGRKWRARSLSLPADATWNRLSLVVFDEHIEVDAHGLRSKLTFAEAGFREPDQRRQLFHLFAAARGILDAGRVASVFRDKTPLKTRVSRLRRLLQELLPIDGDPIVHHKKADVYICQFQIRAGCETGFPAPAGASWFDFRFHEREDGHLVVSVAEKRAFRANSQDPSSGRLVADVAERNETVSRIYSAEELGVRNSKGRLTPEGEVLSALLRGGGRLTRKPDDLPVLKLARWLREWTGIESTPLQFSDASRSWTAVFECSSEVQTA